MRSRLLVPAAFLFAGTLLVTTASSIAAAAPSLLAQQPGGEADTEGGESGEESEGGQEEPETESGAGEGETDEATTEAGPPWTYQMARISLGLLFVLGGALGLLYWRLVGSRHRGAA